MRLMLVEPFFTGSHKQWALQYQSFSRHQVELLTLEGRHWKWRMHGGAISLANAYNDHSFRPDLILATDMLDLTTFLALVRKSARGVPVALYFHENQITYPWSPSDADVAHQRDLNYGFINYVSALAADRVYFNSRYHLSSFLDSLPAFLAQFPDHRETDGLKRLADKCQVLHLGLDLMAMDGGMPRKIPKSAKPVLLWNHRWEFDKNPEQFFTTLYRMKARGIDFHLIVLGERFSKSPAIFSEAKERLAENILHWGYVESRMEYVNLLCLADILPVTSYQDFFGVSIVEAMHCGVFPVLPKRLAYGEHIPKEHHRLHFYDDGGLEAMLCNLIDTIDMVRATDTRPYVQHYDWSSMAGIYDASFQEMTTY